MRQVPQEQPPSLIDPELSGWLSRLMNSINDSIKTHNEFEPLGEIPTKYKAGDVYYFSQAILPDITDEGLWLRKSASWVQLG